MVKADTRLALETLLHASLALKELLFCEAFASNAFVSQPRCRRCPHFECMNYPTRGEMKMLAALLHFQVEVLQASVQHNEKWEELTLDF